LEHAAAAEQPEALEDKRETRYKKQWAKRARQLTPRRGTVAHLEVWRRAKELLADCDEQLVGEYYQNYGYDQYH